MITKVVISAAGKGTRMCHLTKNKSKHLIRISGKPFILYLIENLVKIGLKDIILIIGYQVEEFNKFVRTLPYPITIINQYEVLGKEKYGTACPVLAAEKIVGGENFINIAGDNFYQPDDLKEFLDNDDLTYIGGFNVKDPERFGVLVTDNDGYLQKIIEKPLIFVGSFVNVSLYKFTPEIFEAIRNISLSQRGEYDLIDAINLLAQKHKVKVVQLKNFWLDFGRPSDIFKLSRFLKQNK